MVDNKYKTLGCATSLLQLILVAFIDSWLWCWATVVFLTIVKVTVNSLTHWQRHFIIRALMRPFCVTIIGTFFLTNCFSTVIFSTIAANFLAPTYFAMTSFFTLLQSFLYCVTLSFFTVFHTFCYAHYFSSWLLLTLWLLVPCDFPFSISLQVHDFLFTSLLPSTFDIALSFAVTTFLRKTLFFLLL